MGLSWTDEEAARQEVRAGSPMEWYTVFLAEYTPYEGSTEPTGFYVRCVTPKQAEEMAIKAYRGSPDTYGVFAGRLIDELGQMEFKEVRGDR